MEHFSDDPEKSCWLSIEEYYRAKDRLIQIKLLEYSRRLKEGTANATIIHFPKVSTR